MTLTKASTVRYKGVSHVRLSFWIGGDSRVMRKRSGLSASPAQNYDFLLTTAAALPVLQRLFLAMPGSSPPNTPSKQLDHTNCVILMVLMSFSTPFLLLTFISQTSQTCVPQVYILIALTMVAVRCFVLTGVIQGSYSLPVTWMSNPIWGFSLYIYDSKSVYFSFRVRNGRFP